MAAALRILCALPAARAALAPRVLAAGAVPVVDLTCATEPVAVADGAWVRVRSTIDVPGTGPVVVSAGSSVDGPVEGRETWLETTVPQAPPAGFAGIVLRGIEAGGPCGERPGLALLREVPADVEVMLEAGVAPGELGVVRRAGAAGVVVSDLLMGLPALALPPRLSARLDRADATSSHVVNGFRIQAAPLAPVLRKMLDGASFWEVSRGWFVSDDPATAAWPAGLALGRAREVADRYGDLDGLIDALLTEAEVAPAPAPVRVTVDRSEPIAIVGLGCRLPQASSVDAFWRLVLDGRAAITDVPKDRWDPDLFWDEDRSVPDRTYTRIGGFLTDFSFNPRRFRIPPRAAMSIDPVQQITLEAVADALEDAGLKALPRGKNQTGRDFDRTRAAVILGNSMGGELRDGYAIRTRVPEFQAAIEAQPDFQALPEAVQSRILAGFADKVVDGIPPINEDAMPGELSNVIAGRVANAFDLSGPNFTTDAACASSMAAVQAAVKGLQDGDFDLAVTGGADRQMGADTYTKFCKIGALSPRHSVPFDAEADGFVMGEGCGILVLKRLSDAQRDGDRVYAVIRGIGASSDGKGKGITAPNPRGQAFALERAYAIAGIDPAEVDLFEAHGTSTVVGDKVEVTALSDFIGSGRRGTRGPVRIGSVKSNIGHLKSAAGAASLIKTALAIHHGVLPPSAGFKNARPDVPFEQVPLQVQTREEPWDSVGPRRAGVSAFGFGGTNFHVVLEQHGGDTEVPASVVAPANDTPVPPGLWALSADSRDELAARLLQPDSHAFEPDAPVRVVAVGDAAARSQQLDRVSRTLAKGSDGAMLRSRGIAFEEESFDGKVAFLFTGQGSQYIGMGLELAQRYPVVARTFAEADEVMRPELGRPLTDYIRRDPSRPLEEQFAALQDTAISQPAVLAVDIAILRLMAGFGVYPDLVAGHSLGEYAAVVAAGIMSFEDALVAVSARGREMASVQIDDPGRMAGIAASVERVTEVLAEIPGYVVAANKNCPTQTVIAGETDAVEAAIEAFRSRGVTVHPLPVSHAFHSRIVAPASGPLRRVLDRLDVRAPRRPITTNVTSGWYPNTREEIVDLLAEQVAAPVEWIAQVERMYAEGARVFVECGPKRALTGFITATLKRRPHRAIFTNHPKVGELASFDNALAALVSLGLPVRTEPVEADIFAEPEPRRATTAAIEARLSARSTAPAASGRGADAATGYVLDEVLKLVADLTGYGTEDLNADDELEADLGVDTVKQAEVVARLRDRFQLEHDPDFRLSQLRTLRDLADYAGHRLGATRPAALPVTRRRPTAVAAPVVAAPRTSAPRTGVPSAVAPAPGGAKPGALPTDALAALAQGAVQAGLSSGQADAVARAILPAFADLVASLRSALASAAPPAPEPQVSPPVAAVSLPAQVSVVATGASIGLPGGDAVFSPDNVARVLSGENRIDRLTEADEDALLARDIVRLKKDPKTGQGTFEPVDSRADLIHLAGVGRGVDPADYGIDPRLARALDITSVLAIAAGLEALHDADIPLVEEFRTTGKGRQVSAGWKLPEPLRDTTGVIFASAFPGYTNFARHLANNGADPDGHFDRRFLFQILGMGHSQFAQFIGARGPNTCVNAACASTTQAISIAQDWITTGRAERVVVVGADDVTNDQLLSWIGAGFLAAGAATTAQTVEEGALPFDARRNGMILGMGAVGVVVEREDVAANRGNTPLARLLATRVANSAFHGTRLDADHIAENMKAVVAQACDAAAVRPAEMAGEALFMSHETYTPARGGSAAAEIRSLREAFGDAASRIVVTNTKGFTGHPMGAGIEDAIAIKAMQYEKVPPVPNLKQPDPDLGDLTLSSGETRPLRFAVRLAAGFGSQLALSVWERIAHGDARVADASRRAAWLSEVTGLPSPQLVVEDRTLKARPTTSDAAPALDAAPPAPAAAASSTAAPSSADLAARVRQVLADKTGYDASEFEDDDELEADLGIDTVKQAEVLAELREQLGIPEEATVEAQGPLTVRALADALAELAPGGAPAPAPEAPAPAPASSGVDRAELLSTVRQALADKTGYDADEFEEDDELEADLGIDTVKQAEVLAELRSRLGLAEGADVQASGPLTVGSLTDAIAGALAGGAAPAEAPSTDTPSAAPAAEDAYPSVLAAVRQSLADKTGYDPDEFEEDDELEADLGIDTVKQAEVLAELRERLGLAADAPIPTDGSPTVGGLARALVAGVAGATTPAPDPSADAPVSDDPPEVSDTLVPELEATQDGELPPSFRLRRPVVVPAARMGASRDLAGDVVMVLGEGPFAEALRAELLRRGCVVDPDLAALGDAPIAAVIDAGIRVKETFQAAQALDALPPARWVCATRLGADPSWVDPELGLSAGARAGAAKSLGREWPESIAKVIDVDPLLDDADAAALLVDELASPDPTMEVYLDGRTRQAVRLVVEERPPEDGVLRDNPVIVLTGGTRGVTARVAREIAGRGPARLVLVARTAPGTEPLDETAEKARIKAELKEAGERATPAKVEARLKPLRKAEEARQTIADLEDAGAEVLFVKADMRDGESLDAALAAARDTFGFIDGVIHGAGIEVSRKLADKTVDDFDLIYGSKAGGGMHLVSGLERVAWFVHMGSVAGRFGNAGQIDYSAANEALARVCLSRPRSLHVDWTAWGDTGMAVRGGMQALLESRGVDLLPAAAGAALLVDLIAAGVSGELVVAGALGDFDDPVPHALLDRMHHDGDGVVCHGALSRSLSPWILDHAVDGTPLLPGVVGLELMAAAAMMAAPGASVVGADDVSFSTPVKLYGDDTTALVVRAERNGAHTVSATLASQRAGKGGRTLTADHFSATLMLDGASTIAPLPPAFFFADEPVSREEVYRRFFHGPGFQVIDEVGAIAENGLIADARVDHAAIGTGLLSRPLVLEVAFQAAGLHRMAVHGKMALPESAQAVRWMGAAVDGDKLGVMVQVRENGTYDVDVDGPSGAVLRLRGFAMVDTGPLPDGDRFEAPEDGWPVVLKGAAVTPVVTGVPTGQHPLKPIAAHLQDAASEAVLDEELAWLSARGRPRRVRDRLAGQRAARAAVRAATGFAEDAFTVVRAASGAPEVRGPRPVSVSLTHTDGGAVAVAGPAGHLGLDAETIRLRPPSFSRAWLTPHEQEALGASAFGVTLAWCAKEAALKALGTGLRLHPRTVEVVEVVGRRLHLALHGEAHTTHAALGGAPLLATWARVDDLIVVTVSFASRAPVCVARAVAG